MNLVPQHFWQRLAGVGVLCLGLLSGPTTTAAPSITAWGSATMATKTDGSLLSWGIQCCARSQGSETPVQLASGVDRAFTAYSNLSLLKANGELYIWGNNFANQLLNPSLSRSSTPVLVGTDYVDVVANLSVIAVKRDGSLWAWGDNSYGQLGVGTRDKVTQPTQIGSGFAKLANQGYDFDFTYAIKTDGSLWGWGRSNSAGGRLGDGTSRDILLPERIMGDVASVAVGRYHTVAIKTDGSLWAWGNGPLGDGGFDRSDIPKRIGEGFVTAAAGQLFTLAIKTDGTLWAWGARSGGLVGDGIVPARWGENVPPASRPAVVPLPAGARVARLGVHSPGMAITTDGRVLAWPVSRGPAKAGDVWQPRNPAITDVALPDAAVDVAATGEAQLALLRDGTVWAWGYNLHGLWGNGERADTSDPERWRATPKPVPGVRQAVALATGTAGRHALVLLRDGSLRGWGNSDWGQIGAGVDGDSQLKAVTPRISGVVRVWAGGNNSFALTRDGRFWAWGGEQSGMGLLGAQSKVPVVWPMALLQPG
ncbi:MAG: hypothetical protein CFE45_12415 [Burkholderiales bacterium PBB5]|nr:MAG: hypothetical protein CFE45_12415 [Burkholderiales bacterium PBB5]